MRCNLKKRKGSADIPVSWRYGIDVLCPQFHKGNPTLKGKQYKASVFYNNSGEGKAMQGGPKCTYRGKIVPCFVCTSPKASITGILLKEMLRCMDKLNLFDRSAGRRPFLLLDGHHSRFDINFLDYVHDERNPWEVCIGVPYGTHIWQVADSPQLNGAFKTLMIKVKRKMFDKKLALNRNFEASDIIPIINHCWSGSFGNVTSARKAIAERGWGPLNYCLLDDDKLKRMIQANGELERERFSIQLTPQFNDLNTYNGVAGDLTLALYREELREQGRIVALGKRKAEADATNEIVDICKKFGKVSSGALASAGRYTLCKGTRDLVYKHSLEEIEKKERSQRAKIKKDNMQTDKYVQARNKILDDPTCVLTKDDMKALLKHHKRDGDSKVGERIGDIRKAWAERAYRLYEDTIPVLERRAPPRVVPNNTSQINNASSTSINTSGDATSTCNGPPDLGEFDSLYQSSAIWNANSNPPATTLLGNNHHVATSTSRRRWAGCSM